MKALPPGWERATIGEVGDVMLGRQRSPKWHSGPNMRPYLRVANVFEDRIDLSDVKEMDFPPDQYERFKLAPGDILLNEGQSPEWVGRPAMYRGELPGACFTNSLIRFRPAPGVDGEFALYQFRHLLHSRRFMREARITTNIAHLSSTRFASVEFALPPLAEQKRIVDAIEEHLSRLDAALRMTDAVENRSRSLAQAIVAQLWEEPCERRPLGEISEVIAGPAFRSAEFVSEDDGVRLLRGDNIEPGSLRWKDARCWPHDRLGGLEHLYIEPDDLILAMDRPVISSGLKLAFAGAEDLPALLVQRVARIRVGPPSNARFVYRLLQHPSFVRHLLEGQTGTQVPHVTLEAIRSFKVPVPALQRQRELSDWSEGLLEELSRNRNVMSRSRQLAVVLRRSILAAAFSGQLVPQVPDDAPASVLLERIWAERAAAEPKKRARKAKVL